MALFPSSSFGAKKDNPVDFDYPKEVSTQALSDLKKAQQTGDGEMAIDALVRYGLAQSGISQENTPNIIKKIDDVIATEKRADIKSLLYIIEANIFCAYSDEFAHYVEHETDEPNPADITEWTEKDFKNKISELVEKVLAEKDALRNCPVTNYKKVLTYDTRGALFCPTLFDFMLNEINEINNNNGLTNVTTINFLVAKKEQSLYLKQTNQVAAYLNSVKDSVRSNEKKQAELYEQYKDNEYCGLVLGNSVSIYPLLKDYITRFPDGYCVKQVMGYINEIESKNVVITHPTSGSANDVLTATAEIKNVKDFTITLYEVPASVIKNTRYTYNNIDVKKCKEVKTIPCHAAGTVPFDTTCTVELGKLPYGNYAISISFDADGKTQKSKFTLNDTFAIYDITGFTVNETNKEGLLFAVDRTTGAPIKDVTITCDDSAFSATTKADGSVVLPFADNQSHTLHAQKGDDKHGPEINCYRYRSDPDREITNAKIFTDLAIYRPGETVKLAAVVFRSTTNSRLPLSGEKATITFMDQNGKKIDTLRLTTDGYGRLEGEFKIPTDRMNGDWNIKIQCAGETFYHNITVSEYKTPTFVVEFTDAKTSFTAGQPVKLTGRAATYAGVPVANAQVKIELYQQEWSWWWRNSNGGQIICDTTATTDTDGNFTIEFPDSLFKKEDGTSNYRLWRSYHANVQVTNLAGESQESKHAFVIGKKRSLEINDFTIEASNKATLPVNFNSTDENDTNVPCVYSIEKADGTVVKASSFTSANNIFDLSDVPSGEYTIKVSIANEPEVKNDAHMILYRKTDKQSPVANCPLWVPEKSNYVDKANKAHMLIGVSVHTAHIYYIATSRNKVVDKGWLKYQPGMHDFSVQIPNEPDEFLDVTLYTVYNSEVKRASMHFVSTINEQKLTIKATSFRDKLVPGATERWTFQFVDKNGNPTQGAMILEMYDKALNDLINNSWSFAPGYVNNNLININSAHILKGNQNDKLHFSASNKHRSKKCMIPSINYYGMPFFYIDRMEGDFGGRIFMSKAATPMMDMECEASIGAKREQNSIVEEEALADSCVSSPATEAQLNNIKLRTSDVKTALWHPMLSTDSKGNITLEFTAPEFNTTWIMQSIGYTPSLVSDRLRKEVITQKPLMVKSSLPRFVRQGDMAHLKASIMNSTEADFAYTAIIEMFNPRTNEILATTTQQGTLAKMGTEVIGIDYQVPADQPFVGFRIKAANDTFGDGEQVMLPIISDASPVIETQPFYIDAAHSNFEATMPNFPRDSRVTLEFCNNPVWYCVTALPTIFDSNYHIATSLVHNLFAEVVAQGVAKSQPQIKEAINIWNNDEKDSTLVSMLAKNADLKIGTLLASPWVNDADRQTLRMSRLSELFDATKMGAEHKKIVDALKSMQLSDGGWPWYSYPGAKSSVFVTEEVLEIIGELRHLGHLADDTEINAMANRAMAYYDKEMLRLWDEQHKVNKKDDTGFGSFAYIHTLFPAKPLSKANQQMLNRVLKSLEKEWKSQAFGEKAYMAITLNRYGKKAVAKSIIESIRQHALVKPELGMYWDSGMNYKKVATTATILQAMVEVDPVTAEIDQVRKWMLLMKQTNDWGSCSLAADAVYSILSTGSQWLERSETPTITIDGEKVEFDHISQYVGYCRKQIPAKSNAVLAISRNGNSPAWGSIYCQYQAPMTEVKEKSIDEISIHKEYYVYGENGKLIPTGEKQFKVGNKVQVRLVIKNNRDLEYVTVADERAACFEPTEQISGYEFMDHSFFYRETKDTMTNLFFYHLLKGTHIVNYDVFVTAEGKYSAGIATAQCQYAPQITAHSAGTSLTVK